MRGLADIYDFLIQRIVACNMALTFAYALLYPSPQVLSHRKLLLEPFLQGRYLCLPCRKRKNLGKALTASSFIVPLERGTNSSQENAP